MIELRELLDTDPSLCVNRSIFGDVNVFTVDQQGQQAERISVFELLSEKPDEGPGVLLSVSPTPEIPYYTYMTVRAREESDGLVVDVTQPHLDRRPADVVERALIGLKILHLRLNVDETKTPEVTLLNPRVYDYAGGKPDIFGYEKVLETLDQPVRETVEHWATSPNRDSE